MAGRKKRLPDITTRVLDVLSDCFNAAEAAGFSGDTVGHEPRDINAARRWLADTRAALKERKDRLWNSLPPSTPDTDPGGLS